MKSVISKFAGSQRDVAFDMIDAILPNYPGKIVETGCIRTYPNSPDGASTIVLAQLAQDYDREFISIDIKPAHITKAEQALRENDLSAQMILGDSITNLRDINDIGFLYLDSFDYRPTQPIKCQSHAMGELGAAWGGLNQKCIIAIDDWNQKDGGKGGLVIPYLIDNGFIFYHQGYIVVLVRNLEK